MLNKKALAGTAGAPKVYVEDVFSTWLYTGTGASQTITNGIDLSGKGGMVWTKDRTVAYEHALVNTVTGSSQYLSSNSTAANRSTSTGFTGFTSSGYTLGTDTNPNYFNQSGSNYVSWTFREAPKFFDVVTWTGNAVSGRQIAHNLGSVPGMIIVKNLTNTRNWNIYHRSANKAGFTPAQSVTYFTTAATTDDTVWNNTAPTSTVFSVGTDLGVNASGNDYVAYLFAHDAGGFGDAGTDNIITCGSYTGNGSTTGPTITLGYEPQYVLIKRTNSTGNWSIYDAMRGMTVSGVDDALLYANTTAAEAQFSQIQPLATGFQITATAADVNANGSTYIYMAIRRPMKTPTSGTEVFSPVARTGNGSTASITGINFAPDVLLCSSRLGYWEASFNDRLRGFDKTLYTQLTSAESTNATSVTAMGNTSISLGAFGSVNASGQTYINWILRRATGFFDIVCYTGTGSARTVTHNLGVAPELIFAKNRINGAQSWTVYAAPSGAGGRLILNATDAFISDTTAWDNTAPTSTVFSVATRSSNNANGDGIVAYLFASVNGVSKVGSYTGNGTNQTINCGFSAGARFVLIKATSTTGDWVVLDTARGIVSGNDPFLQLNSTAAEITNEDIVDPDNSGFVVNSTTEAINTNGVSYIYLAIA